MLTKDDLLKVKNIMREEIEVEAKQTRNEMKMVRLHMGGIERRLKDVEISNNNIDKRMEAQEGGLKQTLQELKEAREDVRLVDMKVELVNKKVEILREDMVGGGLGKVIDAIDELHEPLAARVGKLEEHVGIPQPQ